MSDSASSDLTVPAPEPSEKLAEADPSQAAMIPIGEETLQESEELAEAEPSQKVAVPVDESISDSVAPIPPGKRSRRTIVLIGVLLLIVILLGGGSGIYAAVYFTTRPQPSISLTSAYRVGATPTGATGTTFHLTGQKFTGNSVITFLLDGAVVAGSSRTQSNDKGDVTSTLAVTSAWSIGRHTIMARDAAGYLTARGVAIMIVAPGQARTPGPHDAPTDSASGTIAVTVTVLKSADPGPVDIRAGKPAPVFPVTLNLTVIGASNGGTVCASNDDGKLHTQTVAPPGNALGYTETFSATCSGTYQGGRLTYTETITSATIKYDLPGPTGMTCTLKKPYVATRLEGSFTSPTATSGTYSSDPYALRCTSTSGEICRFGADRTIYCQPYLDTADPTTTGTWTGEAAMH